MRVEHEGGAAAWIVGTLVVPNVQGHKLPPLQELWPYQSFFFFFEPLELAIRRSLWLIFFRSSIQALRGLPCLGSFSVVQCVKHIEGPP